jgi:hypothetical protein
MMDTAPVVRKVEMDFETVTNLLKKLGVKYIQDYEYRGKPPNREEFQIPLITYVNFNFTKIEWFEVASNEGKGYIGGCCGQTSAAQDLISKWFRFDSTGIPVRELEELAYIMKSHDGVEEIDPELPRITFAGLDRPVEEVVEICAPKWKQMWPLDRMALVWHIIKDVCKTKPVHVGKTKERSEVERAISMAEICLRYFWLKPLHPNNDKTKSQDRAGDTIRMFRLLPALKTITDHMASEMYEGPFEGYAL